MIILLKSLILMIQGDRATLNIGSILIRLSDILFTTTERYMKYYFMEFLSRRYFCKRSCSKSYSLSEKDTVDLKVILEIGTYARNNGAGNYSDLIPLKFCSKRIFANLDS